MFLLIEQAGAVSREASHLISHGWESTILFLGGGTAGSAFTSKLSYMAMEFPVPEGKYKRWALKCIQRLLNNQNKAAEIQHAIDLENKVTEYRAKIDQIQGEQDLRAARALIDVRQEVAVPNGRQSDANSAGTRPSNGGE